jgi:hypothetical protein
MMGVTPQEKGLQSARVARNRDIDRSGLILSTALTGATDTSIGKPGLQSARFT